MMMCTPAIQKMRYVLWDCVQCLLFDITINVAAMLLASAPRRDALHLSLSHSDNHKADVVHHALPNPCMPTHIVHCHATLQAAHWVGLLTKCPAESIALAQREVKGTGPGTFQGLVNSCWRVGIHPAPELHGTL